MVNENISTLLKRIEMFLEDGDWKKADEYCERVLDIEPECAEAYLGKLLVELMLDRKERLKDCKIPFYENENCKKVLLFGDDCLKKELLRYIETNKEIIERDRVEHEEKIKEQKKKLLKFAKIIVPVIALIIVVGVLLINVIIPRVKNSKQYNEAVELMNGGEYTKAKSVFLELNGYKESEVLSKECDYLYAIEHMNEGNYREAISIFENLAEYKDSEEMVAKTKNTMLENSEVGSYVWYGKYRQDGNTSDKKDIEWLVLDKTNDKILLISKYALEQSRYNDTWEKVSWENCTLRQWLNDGFISAAFTETEAERIIETNTGERVYDKIFLLSSSEAYEYFDSDEDRQCPATEYAYKKGAKKNSNGNCWWALRNNSGESDYVFHVDENGDINNMSYITGLGAPIRVYSYVDNSNDAVRPSMWIRLEEKQ